MVRQLTRGHVLGWTALAYDPGYAAGEGLLVDLSQVQTRFDVLGRSAGYTYQYLHHAEDYTGQASDPVNFTHTYGIQYQGRDGYLEQQVWGHSTLTEFRASTSESVYDGWGRRIAIRENTPLPQSIGTVQDRVRYFSYDGGGMILRRREGLINSSGSFEQDAAAQKKDELYAYANGQQVAKQTRAGALELRTHLAAYQEADPGAGAGRRADRFDAFVGAAMGKYGSVTGRGEQLEDAVTRLTDYSTGALGMGTVQVNSGDTLQGIAQRVYGNAGLWYVLAEANALGNAELVPGTSLRVPSVRVSSNDANTFKPYNPGEIVGSTAPGLPYIEKPKEAGNNCAMMIVMIVAVVVTAIVAPYAAGWVATALEIPATSIVAGIGGAFIAGMAGSVASQVVGQALGVVDHFSLRSAVADGLTDAFTFGLNQLSSVKKLFEVIKNFPVGKVMAKAAANSLIGGVSRAAANAVAGVQGASFSWRGIAANAVSAAISAQIVDTMGFKVNDSSVRLGTTGEFKDDLVNGLVGGVVSLHVRRAFGFDDQIDYGRIAADAFGNAIGHALGGVAVRGIQRAQANRAVRQQVAQLTPEQREIYDSWLQGGYSHQEAMSGVFPTYVDGSEFPFDLRDAMASGYGRGEVEYPDFQDSQEDWVSDLLRRMNPFRNGSFSESISLGELVSGELRGWLDQFHASDQFLEPTERMVVAINAGQREKLKGIDVAGLLADPSTQDVGMALRYSAALSVIIEGNPELLHDKTFMDGYSAYQRDLMSSAAYVDFESADAAERTMGGYWNKALSLVGVDYVSRAKVTQRFGIDSSRLVMQSGYFASVFEMRGTNQIVLANRGTEVRDMRDVMTDVYGGLGYVTRQYDEAVKLATDFSLTARQRGYMLSYTGHSLGGGLAAAQALRTGGSAYTFNAMGLHPNVIAKLGLNRSFESRIKAYNLTNDPLSLAQDKRSAQAFLSALNVPTDLNRKILVAGVSSTAYGLPAIGTILVPNEIERLSINATMASIRSQFGMPDLTGVHIYPAVGRRISLPPPRGVDVRDGHSNTNVLKSLTYGAFNEFDQFMGGW